MARIVAFSSFVATTALSIYVDRLQASDTLLLAIVVVGYSISLLALCWPKLRGWWMGPGVFVFFRGGFAPRVATMRGVEMISIPIVVGNAGRLSGRRVRFSAEFCLAGTASFEPMETFEAYPLPTGLPWLGQRPDEAAFVEPDLIQNLVRRGVGREMAIAGSLVVFKDTLTRSAIRGVRIRITVTDEDTGFSSSVTTPPQFRENGRNG